ncbi:serine/arginine repetitive matrix protein 2-like isoform X3 [Amphibalanus amphitrite]|uniref:serine/arginine repetitive matrix protein 2-like isoform X3 n=1 Tax=Amphibalanus amphitrite TaxID=1232801 RepID=UPI001C90BBC1|nr:serine/arginine repetitive matrix protein 2-like isoform X3 [Amphibalanus amphitrite]
MDSFDSLLTCCVCLDRYRNPKLLPCQHTFCMEPCMEGLIDYVKRQVKCPECRAEHRIPYKGIQEFPSNVTMQRFLEMYQAISGELPDPNQGQVMERCAICNEKEYLQACAHCDKKVCPDCKSAHVDVLKREVVRINNQVRRGIHKLYDILSGLEKSAGTVQQNCTAVREEVDSLGQRLIKAIRDRTEVLKAEVDVHMATEVSNLNTLKSNLQQEIANIESNSELAERHMGDTTEWDDAELMDAKDIFLKTVEFIRNFEQEAPSASDYRKPVRFNASQDPNSLSRTLEQFGELNITRKELQDAAGINGSNGFPALMPSSSSAGPGLMRSKSDHRLVAQLRQQEERYGDDSGRSSPVSRRRFGDRAGRRDSMAADYDDTSYDSPCERRHKYRSRFTRRNLNLDDDLDSYRPEPSAAAQEAAAAEKKKEREKVLDTEDASRGALSGIVRIADVPRVIQKLADSERGPRKREEPKPAPVKATPAAPAAPAGPVPWRRQKSEDDEIAKIKKQNKEADARCSRGGAAAAAAAAPAPADETPSPRAASVSRSSVERRTGSQPSTPTSTMSRPRFTREESGSETEDSVRRRPSRVSRPSAGAPISESANEPRAPPSAAAAAQRKISEPIRGGSPRVAAVVSRSSSGGSLNREAEAAAAERPRATLRTTWERRGSRSNSSESTSSASESSASAAPKSTGAAFSTNELKSRFMRGGAPPAPPDPPRGRVGAGASAAPPTRPPPAGAPSESSSATPTRPRFQSRFLGRAGTPKAEPSTKSESSESSSESDSDSSDSDSSSEDDTAAHSFRGRASSNMAKTSIGPLLARSALARKDSSSAAEPPATSPSTRTGRTAGSYGAARREASLDYSTPTTSSDRYQSRYSRDTTDAATEPKPYESRYGSSRYSGDYTPTNGLARSRTSSHLESRSSAYDPDSYSSYSSKYSRPTRPSYDDYTPRYSSYSSRFLNRDESSAAHHAPETEAPRPTGAAAAAGPAAAVAGGSRTEGTSRYAPSTEARRPGRAGSTSSDRSDGQGSGGRASPEPPRPSEQRENSDSGASGGERAEPAPAAGSKSEALSTWAQYLKNKYGYTGKDGERGKVQDRVSRRRSGPADLAAGHRRRARQRHRRGRQQQPPRAGVRPAGHLRQGVWPVRQRGGRVRLSGRRVSQPDRPVHHLRQIQSPYSDIRPVRPVPALVRPERYHGGPLQLPVGRHHGRAWLHLRLRQGESPRPGVSVGRHVRGRHRLGGAHARPAGAPALHRRERYQPGGSHRQQQPPRSGVRRQRKVSAHLRRRGRRGGKVQVPQGCSRGRPGLHHRRRLGKQPDPDLQSRRRLPEGVRRLGRQGRRVQRSGGCGRHLYWQRAGVRPREPPGAGVLTSLGPVTSLA